ncbi:MAG: hypothetical protein Q7S40_23625 [Opitutaceae bacterium]|nr:hypothetical protein [Opitutaceae bacterium]
MPFPIPHFRPPPIPEPTPIVRVVGRDVTEWDRPLFKAPALEIQPKKSAIETALESLRPVFTSGR